MVMIYRYTRITPSTKRCKMRSKYLHANRPNHLFHFSLYRLEATMVPTRHLKSSYKNTRMFFESILSMVSKRIA
ncbi:Protein of unknown function [Pyronema omphalodes CBS 100304]|uniref:Uncharacterized protein n=1 Tax=Pyronema omphalodes (strain CBS 100304) TaxID=1076935 RepID=U4LT12_PYROM|nr:Protein of unknown function [Pyronema omphalodes CBS 100304]